MTATRPQSLPEASGADSAAGSGERKVASAAREPLGYRARRLFKELGIKSTRRDPGHALAHILFGPFAVDVARLLIWWCETSGPVKKATGISRWFQFFDVIKRTWPERLHGQIYYMFELYRPEEHLRRGEYLTRWETKNGLFRLLRRELIDKSVPRSNLRDKVSFTEKLLKNGLPGIPVVASFDGGKSTPAEIDPAALQRDLFTKLRAAKGAQGAGLIKYLGNDGYRYGGRDYDRAALLAQLAEQSKEASLIVLPYLTNHPDIAGLSGETLMAVRTFSMLNEQGEPEIVFAMLRILGKLEPTWHSRIEWAAPVNLETGALGLLTGDVPEAFTARHTHHPVTGHRVEGLILPFWQQLRTTALTAHRELTMDRLVIGWDIAITPNGPYILEGNVLPDVTFPQRVGHRPFGQSRYGEILHYQLDRLEQKLGRPVAGSAAPRG